MKKLALLLLTLILTACDTPQSRTDRYIKPVCYEGVTYLLVGPPSEKLGITIQLDKEGKVVPCNVAFNEDGKKVYQLQQ